MKEQRPARPQDQQFGERGLSGHCPLSPDQLHSQCQVGPVLLAGTGSSSGAGAGSGAGGGGGAGTGGGSGGGKRRRLLVEDSAAQEDMASFSGGELAVGRIVRKAFDRRKYTGVVERYIPGDC